MADTKKIYQLTEEGKKDKEERLSYLKNVLRPANVEAIKAARSQGDLSENADYSAAREEQGKIESEIAQLEDILQHCEIITNKDDGRVSLGKKVSLKINGMLKEYTIVSTIEVDPKGGKISDESPLGSNLYGHKVGDTVRFKTESDREVVAEILDIVNA